MVTDPISNMLTSIRNAQVVKQLSIDVPFSTLKYEIAKILQKNGFITQVEKKGKKNKKFIEIILKYNNGVATISGIKRISKPGQRIYVSVKEIRKVKSGYGLAIISTPRGLMTNTEARKNNLGGEVICEIW